MADLSDLLLAVVQVAAAAVYPNGTASPSVAGLDVRIRPGWPTPAELDDDQGTTSTPPGSQSARVSVYPQPGHTRNTTRYPQAWQDLELGTPTVTATLDPTATVITFGGTIASGQNVGVLCAGTGYILAVQPEDALTDIATGLASQIDGASSNGPVLTLPTPGSVTVSAVSSAISELRRQEQGVMATVWAPTPAVRDTISAAVDLAIAGMSFIALPDQLARIRYTDTRYSDASEDAKVYRRDLIYLCEYATIATIQAAPMIYGIGQTTEEVSGVVTPF